MGTVEFKRWLLTVLMCASVSAAHAGTNGAIEGLVKEKRSGEPIPGVNIQLDGTQLGTTTATDGHYELRNIRAGSYTVKFTHVGYASYVVRNVVVHPDRRTKLDIELESSDVQVQEIVVTRERPLIERDVTGTTFVVSGEVLEMIPVDNVTEVLGLSPGTTIEGNVRGGKSHEVLYLVDGLPVQDVLSGGVGTTLPNSSVVGLSMYTGGFEAEYGNALSGVVNIVTRSGSNEPHFSIRADKDNLFGGTQVSKTSEFEVSGSGPILTDRLFFMGSVNGQFSDTRWWQDFQHYFPSPIEKTFSGFGKIDYVLSPAARLSGQLVYSHKDLRPYEFSWRFNLGGLPQEDRTSYRTAVILTHTLSDDFFYTASLSRFRLDSRIGEGDKSSLRSDNPYQYDFFLRYVIAGQRAQWSETAQETYTLRFDGTLNAGPQHLLKMGTELNFYNVETELVKYEPRKTYFGKPITSEPQLNFSTAFQYRPRSGSVYVQDKIDVSREDILINVGLRYDFLDPTATRPAIEAIPVQDTAYTFVVKETVKAKLKHQLSPRFGAAMQFAENGYFFVNLGWYFQYPLFNYLYSGLDRVGLARGVGALTGNPDLDPERTLAWEISVKYGLSPEVVGSIAYFKKETTNQIDTKTFIPADSKLAGSFGFAEYVNNPYAEAKGVEVTLSRAKGSWLQGEVSYTYMIAEGTSGSEEDGFYIAQYGKPPASRVYPLSWDQRHTVKLLTTFEAPWDMRVNAVGQWHSGRPYTRYPTSTGFESIDGGRFHQNNERMASYLTLDLKAEQSFRMPWWPQGTLSCYVDVRNLSNTKNVKWVDSNGVVGGELHDPSGYYIGRRTSVGVRADF